MIDVIRIAVEACQTDGGLFLFLICLCRDIKQLMIRFCMKTLSLNEMKFLRSTVRR